MLFRNEYNFLRNICQKFKCKFKYLNTILTTLFYFSSLVECFDPDHDHLTINANAVVHRGNPEDIESVNNVPQLPLHHLIQPQQPAQV